MNIQIIGTKKCNDTRKAERFFKERGIKYHLKDLKESELTKGELDNIKRSIPVDELIDKEGKQYKKRNMEYMVFDIEEELLEDPLLMKTPVVRMEGKNTVGYQPDVWTEWIK